MSIVLALTPAYELCKLEVETETNLQTKYRTVTVYVPVHSRLKCHRPRQEESITRFRTKRKLGIIACPPIPTVYVDISAQI